MERTWLTFHCWLYILYIIVYVTNKNLELEIKLYTDFYNHFLWHLLNLTHLLQYNLNVFLQLFIRRTPLN